MHHHHTPTQPFIEERQPVLRLFPRTSVLYLPLGLFIASFLAAVLGFVGWLMVSEGPVGHSTAAELCACGDSSLPHPRRISNTAAAVTRTAVQQARQLTAR